MAKVKIKKFAESATRTYWVSETGNFYSISKKTKERKILKAVHSQTMRSYKINAPNSDGKYRSYSCKNVVAKLFHPDWEEQCVVKTIDGDERNCHVDNLQCISASDHGHMIGKLGGRKNKYLYGIYDGDDRIFVGTNRECSEFLGYKNSNANTFAFNNHKARGKYIIKVEGEIK